MGTGAWLFLLLVPFDQLDFYTAGFCLLQATVPAAISLASTGLFESTIPSPGNRLLGSPLSGPLTVAPQICACCRSASRPPPRLPSFGPSCGGASTSRSCFCGGISSMPSTRSVASPGSQSCSRSPFWWQCLWFVLALLRQAPQAAGRTRACFLTATSRLPNFARVRVRDHTCKSKTLKVSGASEISREDR